MTTKEQKNETKRSIKDIWILIMLKRFLKTIKSVLSAPFYLIRKEWITASSKKDLNTKDGITCNESCKLSVNSIAAKSPELVDWSVKDVLVGSLGSIDQLKDNLARRYYYVPAENVYKDSLPVQYIALYQSYNLFGESGGIKYYGEVIETKRVKRKNIDFPIRRNNGEEWYYAFRVKSWNKLPVAIAVKDEGVYKPKFTNMFLSIFARTMSLSGL